MTGASLTRRLARTLRRPVCVEDRQRARIHLLDWMGCVAGASDAPVAAHIPMQEDALERASWLGNVLEMDDIHRMSILHPGPVIWPAALSRPGCSLEQALDAAISGYQAMIAVGCCFDARHYAFYHTTATAGVFGAAVAAAMLNGADEDALTSAMGLAGSMSGGLWRMRHEDCDAKQFHVARAAANGMAAAAAALSGVRGPEYILEGEQGLFAATCANPRPMPLEDRWTIHDVSIKPWAACRHAHPSIDAALRLREQGPLDGPIEVRTYADAIRFCDRPDPVTVLDAKFSLQHAVALIAERGAVQLDDFGPEAIRALAPVRARISVVEDPALSAAYPEHYGASIRCGGRSAVVMDTLGDPDNPLDDAGCIAKFAALARWGGCDDPLIDAGLSAALEGDDIRAIHDWLGNLA
ncbi:MmgE/PrpD family protein [Sphingosinithalassobacter portus]|uniref:MmgE/PrpD family protein n=1 Tax=Stakelama portus TaxID=2676234 RepID=UPI000D6E0A5C|nr:MmgE/PrpD family protein [Sphingosinithalassobacter portus]